MAAAAAAVSVFPASPLTAAQSETVSAFVRFLTSSVTPFHAVDYVATMLRSAGYEEYKEASAWSDDKLAPGKKAFVIRNDTSIVAFAVGGNYAHGKGFKICGAHTDSPNLQLKPMTATTRGKYMGVGVQLYGGGLWHTWFDRDLTVAGRLLLQREAQTHVTSTLVNLKRPILRIPTLAIHLTSGDEREKFGPNKESHVCPVISTELAARANGAVDAVNGQNATLLGLLATQAGVKPSEIVDFDLSVVDTQAPCVGGAFEEFIFSPRLDNLISCFCTIQALVDADATLASEDMVRMVGLFDHEEIGSSSAHGAAGTLVPDIIERFHIPSPQTRPSAIAQSFFLSVDGAHAVHPNYADRHEAEHRPLLHGGPVIKYNANARYATNGSSAAVIKALAGLVNVPVQQFCVKNDSPCGSTIGPIISTLTGIQSADIGNPMLSMHSIRETCGTIDVCHMINLVQALFEKYQSVRME